VGVRSISSNSVMTASALMVGGVERTAGNAAHHSRGFAGSVIMSELNLFDLRTAERSNFSFEVDERVIAGKAALGVTLE